MARDTTQPHVDYYATLNLDSRRRDPSLTTSEVKAAYKRALLVHHPDKSHAKPTEKAGPTVDAIALAYQILSSPSLKKEYDRGLATSQSSGPRNEKVFHTGLDTVDLDDLWFSDETGKWSRGCRCGDEGGFEVTEAELERNAGDGEFITGCRGCSLWLRVLFSVEEG